MSLYLSEYDLSLKQSAWSVYGDGLQLASKSSSNDGKRYVMRPSKVIVIGNVVIMYKAYMRAMQHVP